MSTITSQKAFLAELAKGSPRIKLGVGRFSATDRVTINYPVTIEGSGRGATEIALNTRLPKKIVGDDVGGLAIFADGVTIRDLDVRNVAEGVKPVTVRGHWGRRNSNVVFSNVGFFLSDGLPIKLSDPLNFVMQDCFVGSNSNDEGPLSMSCENGFFLANEFAWRANRLRLNGSRKTTFARNRFTVVGDQGGETGGVEMAWCQDCRFENNHGTLVVPRSNADGEGVTTQIGPYDEFSASGVVMGVGYKLVATSIPTPKGSLYGFNPVFKRKVLYVLTGKAAGSWTFATPTEDAGTFVTESYLPVVEGDVVVFASVNSLRNVYTGNVMKGWSTALQTYQGGIGVVVEGNVCDAPIMLRAEQKVGFYPLLDCVVRGNAVLGTGRVPANVFAYGLISDGTGGLPGLIRNLVLDGNAASGRGKDSSVWPIGRDGWIGVWTNNEKGIAGPSDLVVGTKSANNAMNAANPRAEVSR